MRLTLCPETGADVLPAGMAAGEHEARGARCASIPGALHDDPAWVERMSAAMTDETHGRNAMLTNDRTTKAILIAIALGLWMNIAVAVFRATPAVAQSNSAELTALQTIDTDIKAGTTATGRELSQIAGELAKPLQQAAPSSNCPSGQLMTTSGCIRIPGT